MTYLIIRLLERNKIMKGLSISRCNFFCVCHDKGWQQSFLLLQNANAYAMCHGHNNSGQRI